MLVWEGSAGDVTGTALTDAEEMSMAKRRAAMTVAVAISTILETGMYQEGNEKIDEK